MPLTDHPPASYSCDLSVIVTIVEGDPALTRCLEALRAQADSPLMEIIVPYDDTVAEVELLREKFPAVRFIALGALVKKGTPLSAFVHHVLYDRRRAGGLRFARGRLVAILEDRGRPRPDWGRAMVDLHQSKPHSVIGGAIDNGADDLFRWAVFFCDFSRYQAPLEVENAEYVTDVNICYKHEALESVRDLWQESYQEPVVNWALRRRGHNLYISDRPVVIQERKGMGVLPLLKERVHWGRMFGQIRGRQTSRAKCLIWAAVTPLLPTLLFSRHFRRQLQKKRRVGEFVRASPAILLLLHFWAIGECIGYLEAAIRPSGGS